MLCKDCRQYEKCNPPVEIAEEGCKFYYKYEKERTFCYECGIEILPNHLQRFCCDCGCGPLCDKCNIIYDNLGYFCKDCGVAF